MKTKIFVGGISALALVFVVGLTGCAYEAKMVKETPVEQRASLYLAGKDARIEKLDGNKLKMKGFATRGNRSGLKDAFTTTIPGTNTEKTRDHEIAKSMDVTPGVHTLSISDAVLVGRKKYEGTFTFEAGKKYVIRLVTPTQYESMMKPGFDGFFSDLGAAMKESLAGNNIVIIKEYPLGGLPRDPDFRSDSGRNWIRGDQQSNNAAQQTTDTAEE